MTPTELTEQARAVLELLSSDEGVTKDPAELMAVLRIAAASCEQVHNHNTAAAMMQSALNTTM